jgi:hypothetical protein
MRANYLSLLIVAAIASDCATAMPGVDRAGTVVWTLDNVKSIGGQTPEILGSPQVISTSQGPAIQFNGRSDGLILPVNPIKGWARFTIQVLFKPESPGPEEQRYLHIQTDAGPRGLMELRLYDKAWALDAFLLSGQSQKALFDKAKLNPADRWTWVAMTYGQGKITSYVDGVQQLEGEVTVAPMGEGKISLGVRQNKVAWFKGQMRQVRFDPEALSAEKLERAK